MNFSINPFLGGYLSGSFLAAQQQNSANNTNSTSRSGNIKGGSGIEGIHGSSGPDSAKPMFELQQLAAVGKVLLFMKRKRNNKRSKPVKAIPFEGEFPNPFSDTEEENLYNEVNFAHGKLVDPFEYRKKMPWLLFSMAEKFSDFMNRTLKVYDPTKKIEEMPIIRASHLKQGGISNCWLIATLAVLAQKKPDLITSMIKADKDNNKYIVNLVDGREIITLDPINIKSRAIAKTGAAWVGIIEAAVAKAIGHSFFKKDNEIDIESITEERMLKMGYEIMDNGNYCSYAIYYLTGKQAVLNCYDYFKEYSGFKFNWKDKLVVLGNHHYEQRVPGAPDFDPNYDGLVSRHAYALLEQVDDKKIYLFNPWGEYEPGSKVEPVIERFNSYDLCNDGVFELSADEFIEKRDWNIYVLIDKPAKNLEQVLHRPLPPSVRREIVDDNLNN